MRLTSSLSTVSRLWGNDGTCPSGFVVLRTIPGGVNPAWPQDRYVISGQPGGELPPADVLLQVAADGQSPWEYASVAAGFPTEAPMLLQGVWLDAEGEQVRGWLSDKPAGVALVEGPLLPNVWMGEVLP